MTLPVALPLRPIQERTGMSTEPYDPDAPEVNDPDVPEVNDPEQTEDSESTKTVDLYDANEGRTPRTGGPYLDQEERRLAEIQRAAKENRDPDLDNPPPTVGTVLVPKEKLVDTDVDKQLFNEAEITTQPVSSYVVEEPVTEPDPLQPDWNNDAQQVTAAEHAARLQEAKSKLSQ